MSPDPAFHPEPDRWTGWAPSLLVLGDDPIHPPVSFSLLTDATRAVTQAVHPGRNPGELADRPVFLTRFALRERWRLIPASANGQPAFGAYAWEAEKGSYTPLSLDVLTLEGARVTEITSFVTPATHGPARERFAADVFKRFGIPDRLD